MPQEHGFGAIDPGTDERDFFVAQATLDRVAAPIALPSSFLLSGRPPITDQGLSPECVAYSSAYEQNWQDNREHHRFYDFDEHRFFNQIGGTASGASTRDALDRLLKFGYPEQDATPSPEKHEIAAYYQVPLDANAIKQAIVAFGGVLMVGNWFDSWVHPVGDKAVLPAPSGSANGHQWWAIGWDSYGLIGQNTWGWLWGDRGTFRMPWAYLVQLWSAWKTADDKTVVQAFPKARIRRTGIYVHTAGVLGDKGTKEGTRFARVLQRGIKRLSDDEIIVEPYTTPFRFKGFQRGAHHGVAPFPNQWGAIEIRGFDRAVARPYLHLL